MATRLRPWGIVLLSLALVLAACTSTEMRSQGEDADGVPSTLDTGSSDPSVGPKGSSPSVGGGGGSTSGPSRTPRSASKNPIQSGEIAPPGDKSPLKVGFILATGDSCAAFGADNCGGASEDQARQVLLAMVAEINENGGLGGHPIAPLIRGTSQTDQSQDAQSRSQNNTCIDLTEDEKVFMVVSFGVTNYARECYASHKTPLLDSLVQTDAKGYKDVAPWVIPPLWMNATNMARLMPRVWDQEGFLTKKMGLIAYIGEASRRSEDVMVAEIEKRGGKVIEAARFPVTYDGVAAGTASAVLAFKNAGVDRVIVWATLGGAWLLFAQQAEAQLYRPRYAVSTFQYPRIVMETGSMPQAQLNGTLGVGFYSLADLNGAALPAPTKRERACWEMISRRTQITIANRQTGDTVTPVCEFGYLLKAALAPAKGRALGQADVPTYFERLGRGFSPIVFPGSHFGAGRLDAISSYRIFTYDSSCGCMRYKVPWRGMPF